MEAEQIKAMLKANLLAIQPHGEEGLTKYQHGYKDALTNVLRWVERNEKSKLGNL